jgi:cytochrome c biogenesis protein
VNEKKENQDIVDKIWEFLASIKLAIILIALIALTSIVGTVIPQRAEPERQIEVISGFVGESLAPTAFRIIDTLNFTDMYHSWWFLALLFIFAANLIICSIERLPQVWKLTKEPIKPLPVEAFKSMPINREIIIDKKLKGNKAADIVGETFKKIGFKKILKAEDEGNELQFYAEKGRYSRLGVYITHFSMIVMFIGALAAVFFGWRGGVNILEGTSTSVVYSREDGSEIPLGFEVKVHDFHTYFWGTTDRPKEFRSWITLLENGKPVKGFENFVLEVNRPLRYKGIIFYQASYGYHPNEDALFKFSVTPTNGKKEDVAIKFGESFAIPGTDVAATVADFSPALGIDQQGRLFTYTENMHNPAVFVRFINKNGQQQGEQWLLSRYPETWRTPYGTIEFVDFWGAQFTGLQVRKDPGVWLVYLGFLLMTIGFYMAFFMSHKRIWGRLTEDGKIIIAASSNKGREPYERKIDTTIKEVIKHG